MKTFVLPAVLTLFALSEFSTSALADQLKCPAEILDQKVFDTDKNKWEPRYAGFLENAFVQSGLIGHGERGSFVQCKRHNGAMQIWVPEKECTLRPGDKGKLQEQMILIKDQKLTECNFPRGQTDRDNQSSCVISCD